MIAKKTRKADLERKRFAFFQIGLIMAGALCLTAFEFVTPQFTAIDKQTMDQDTVFTFPDIPMEIVASSQPKTKPVQQIRDEVKLVIELPPKPVTGKMPDQSKIDLGDLDNMLLPEGQGTITSSNLGSEAWTYVDEMPVFPGNLNAWIGKNIKLPHAMYGQSGTIYVSFVVSKTGDVTNVKISQSLDTEHDRAAMAVVKKMPKWKPGEMFGKPVAVNYHLPIKIVRQ